MIRKKLIIIGVLLLARFIAQGQWILNTTDTYLSLNVQNNRPTITLLKNPAKNWNWTPVATEIPLIAQINGVATNWTYQAAVVDNTVGKKVSLRFSNSSPQLALESVWWARPGVGPIEMSVIITNNSGSSITFNQADVMPLQNIVFSADAPATLKKFEKVADSRQAGANNATPVLSYTLLAGDAVAFDTKNGINNFPNSIPFMMLDVHDGAGRALAECKTNRCAQARCHAGRGDNGCQNTGCKCAYQWVFLRL